MPMLHSNYWRTRIGITSLLLACAISLAPPAIFMAARYADKSRSVPLIAQLDATNLAAAAQSGARISSTALDVMESAGRTLERRVLNPEGLLVAQSSVVVDWPALTRSAPIMLEGELVGTLHVTTGLRSVLAQGALMALLCALIGGAAILFIKSGAFSLITRLLAEQKAQNVRFDTAINNMGQGLCFFDGTQRLIVCNDKYAAIYQLSRDLMRPGTTLGEIVDHRFAVGCFPAMERAEYLRWRDSIAIADVVSDTIVELRDGRTIAIHHQPMPGGGWVATHEDITERRRTEARIARQRDELDMVVNIVGAGVFDFDNSSGKSYFSPQWMEMMGFSPGDADLPGSPTRCQERIHPDDIDKVMSQRAAAKEGEAVKGEYRYRKKDGSYLWISSFSRSYRDIADGHEHFMNVMVDISASKTVETELIRHQDQLHAMVADRTMALQLAKEQAEDAREQADRANQAKSEFLSNMSHELRTPMHAVMSFSTMGIDRVTNAPASGVERDKILRYFTNIRSSAERLKRLLDDLLDLAKMEAGKMDFDLAPGDLAVPVRQLAAEFDGMARARAITLEVCVAALQTSATFDAARIQQVLANLLSNALKFGKQGGRVTVRLEQAPVTLEQGCMLELTVEDDGPGIPNEELDCVFEKFIQSSRTKTGAGGTGLGLSITRQIVEAHGGRIWARNREQGGAAFHVRLPAAVTETV